MNLGMLHAKLMQTTLSRGSSEDEVYVRVGSRLLPIADIKFGLDGSKLEIVTKDLNTQ